MVFAVISGLLLPVAAISQDSDDPVAPEKDLQPLHITADSLVAFQNNQHVVFSGHVIAVYQSTTITSDKLQVFYNDQAKKDQLDSNSVKKIIATGNVHIELEDKSAQCDQAVYNPSSDSLILSGEKTRLQSQNNYITGNTITIYQKTGQIIVDGSADNRVNAVFQPENNKSITDLK